MTVNVITDGVELKWKLYDGDGFVCEGVRSKWSVVNMASVLSKLVMVDSDIEKLTGYKNLLVERLFDLIDKLNDSGLSLVRDVIITTTNGLNSNTLVVELKLIK